MESTVIVFGVLAVAYGLLTVLSYLPGLNRLQASQRARVRASLAAMFLLAATSRLARPETLLAMIPTWLPFRRAALYASGAAEAAGAIGLMVPPLRRPAGLGLVGLLVAIFPANVNVAVHNLQIEGYPKSAVYQWARLPLQIVLVWLVLWTSQPDD
jgi:uncharacterized membrane protein